MIGSKVQELLKVTYRLWVTKQHVSLTLLWLETAKRSSFIPQRRLRTFSAVGNK